MADENAGLSRAFIERQRQQLQALRQQLLELAEEAQAEERAVHNANLGEPRDFADEGATLTQEQLAEALHDVSERRLRDVERALEKIEDGTYGLSDASGEPIARARLEAVPEAIYTLEEERQRERTQAT